MSSRGHFVLRASLTVRRAGRGLCLPVLLALAATLASGAPAAPGAGRSLLDALPRVTPAQAAAAIATARARGDLLQLGWLELFYGTPEEKRGARADLDAAARQEPNRAAVAFAQYVLEQSEGQERASLAAALRVIQLAPDDVAAEVAARALAGTLELQGPGLFAAAPVLREALQRPLRDPVTVYMLGKPLPMLVGAPGVALSAAEAGQLAGRPQPWTLFGPFGRWRNLDFDRAFPVESSTADSYRDGARILSGQPFDAVLGAVAFPADWDNDGIEYAVTYVQAAAPTAALVRLYSGASAALFVNGREVLRNDRRAGYVPATRLAALELPAGWSRVVVKLGGQADRTFSLLLRSAAGPANGLQFQRTPPAGTALASGVRSLPAPDSLAHWAEARLAQSPTDALALWLDAVWRIQDEDAATARLELQRAVATAPASAPLWLSLAEADALLPDAGQSWAAAQVRVAAGKALAADPAALPAMERLGRVAESEGKHSDAAAEYAACAAKGSPECDWSEFRLAARQHWGAEARLALQHAVAARPSDWENLLSGLAFYTAEGDQAAARALEQQMARDVNAQPLLARFDLDHGQAAEAVPMLAAAVGRDASSAVLRREYLEALLRSNAAGADAAARAALSAFPDDAQVAGLVAEIRLAGSRQAGIAQLRQSEFRRGALRHAADFLTDSKFWQPWYHSAEDVMRESPGKEQYPNASSVLVLDQMVDRLNADATRDSYIHQVIRVLDTAGIQLHGDQNIPPGSDLLAIRTIKPDGTTLLPENVSNLSSITMPGLEPGDFIETEYVMHRGPSSAIPRTLENDMFFVFNSSREPFHYSDYIVLTPQDMPLLIDEERFPQPPVVSTHEGWSAREWLIRKTRLLGREPNMPPEQELVPKVWVSSPLTWDEISQYFGDQLFQLGRSTAAMQAEAARLVAGQPDAALQARALFDWVLANIRPVKGAGLAPAGQYFEDRSGNRLATFLGLLSAAHVPFDFAVARAVTDNASLKIPSLFTFQYPLIRVGDAWFDLGGDFAHEDYINPAVRGGLAVLANHAGPGVFTHVPNVVSTLDGIVLDADAQVQPTGDANLKLTLEFRGPTGQQVRDWLNNVPENRLPQVYQQLALTTYPNASTSGGSIENLDKPTEPLIVHIDAGVPDFVHRDGQTWAIEHIVGSVGLLARYASLPSRVFPLIIPGDSFEEAHVRVHLPPPFRQPQAPAPVDLQNAFGRFHAAFRLQGQDLTFDRSVALGAASIAPGDYPAFRLFGEQIDNQDRLQVSGTLQP